MNTLRAATLAALKAVRDEVTYKTSGICANMDFELRERDLGSLVFDANGLIQRMWILWPKYSGNYTFPVAIYASPNRTGAGAVDVYLDNIVPKWGNNSYGSARRELLDWLIAELEQETLHAVTLTALKAIRTEVARPDNGICGNLDEMLLRLDLGHLAAEANALLRSVWVRWPKYSGNTYYPVHATGPVSRCDENNAVRAAIYYADSAPLKWGNNSYGSARRELLDWLIAELEKEAQS